MERGGGEKGGRRRAKLSTVGCLESSMTQHNVYTLIGSAESLAQAFQILFLSSRSKQSKGRWKREAERVREIKKEGEREGERGEETESTCKEIRRKRRRRRERDRGGERERGEEEREKERERADKGGSTWYFGSRGSKQTPAQMNSQHCRLHLLRWRDEKERREQG